MQKSTVKYPFLTEDVEIYERENGHKIVLAHKEGELVNVSTWVKTGSINEDDKINGISFIFMVVIVFANASTLSTLILISETFSIRSSSLYTFKATKQMHI